MSESLTNMTIDSKTELMKKLFHQHDIQYDDNVMGLYENWLTSEKPTGNRYQKMSQFVKSFNPVSKPHSDLMRKICSNYNIPFTENMIPSYFDWESNTRPPGNRYQKMCQFLNITEGESEYESEYESEEESEYESEETEESEEDLDEDLEDFEELQDDENAKRTMLMKHLFHQRFLDFTDDVMHIYYIWERENTGNLYQKMCLFIDEFDS